MAKRHKFGDRHVDFTAPRTGGSKKQRHSGFGRQAAKSTRTKKTRKGNRFSAAGGS